MELGLTLGESPAMGRRTAEKGSGSGGGMGFSMELGLGFGRSEEIEVEEEEEAVERERGCSGDPPPSLQLELLPLAPHLRPQHSSLFPWPLETRNIEAGTRGFDVNRTPVAEEMEEEEAEESPNNSTTGGGGGELERGAARGSDEEENGSARKKLRLSKEQSAFLEESFKEHNTLNPKQKLALAKQLNLRPRQVEVWFQNRRARTKLKQTEVDCEYLKRCCETLTEENRRLHKELSELRALKATAAHPILSHLPATTLSMCPSCERITTTTSAAGGPPKPVSPFSAVFSRPRFFPFAAAPPHQPSAAS